jgi:putative transcriptional regulator
MQSLTNHFLIAMPSLEDPNFSATVSYICEHNENGALGLIVNQPLTMTVAELMAELQIDVGDRQVALQPVFRGGPVQQDRGFVLHTAGGEWESSLAINEELSLTTSRDVLLALADGDTPMKALIALGYAGWGAGQLEAELAENSWLSVAADPHILFDVPHEERWRAAAELLGVDLDKLSSYSGHA